MSPHDGRDCPTTHALIVRDSSLEVCVFVDPWGETEREEKIWDSIYGRDGKPTDARNETSFKWEKSAAWSCDGCGGLVPVPAAAGWNPVCQHCLHRASLASFISNTLQHNRLELQEEYLMCCTCIIYLLPVEIKAIKAAFPPQREVANVPPGPAEPPLALEITQIQSSCIIAACSAVTKKKQLFHERS